MSWAGFLHDLLRTWFWFGGGLSNCLEESPLVAVDVGRGPACPTPRPAPFLVSLDLTPRMLPRLLLLLLRGLPGPGGANMAPAV